MMKSFTAATALVALVTQASAHYIFEYFDSGGLYENIRPNTNMNSPVTDLSSTDLRCNVGGDKGGSTTTASVVAGSSHTFTADVAVYHQGPVSFYMSAVPSGTDISSYDGSGNWFKIAEIGPTFTSSCSATWNLAKTYSVKIPAAVPSGDYLLRIEQLGIHNPYPGGTPQFYLECAQIRVTGGGSGSPSPLVKIPGHVKVTDPGYTANIYSNFCNYTVPGPAVWNGSGSSGGGGGGGGGGSPTTTLQTSTTSAKTSTTTTKPTSTTAKTTATPTSTGTCAAKYAQCGGSGWQGPTCCAAGSTCTASGSYYSQCL